MIRKLLFSVALLVASVAHGATVPVTSTDRTITPNTTACFNFSGAPPAYTVDSTGNVYKCVASKWQRSDLPACPANPPTGACPGGVNGNAICKTTNAATIYGCDGSGNWANLSGSGASPSGATGDIQRNNSGALGTVPGFTGDGTTGAVTAKSLESTSASGFGAFLHAANQNTAFPATFNVSNSPGYGLSLNKPTAASGSNALHFFRGGAWVWAIGEDYLPGERSYFGIHSTKSYPGTGAWGPADMVTMSWGGAETSLAGYVPRVPVNSRCTASVTPYSCCTGSGTGTCGTSDQPGVDGPKFIFNGSFVPASSAQTYSGPFTYTFNSPTLQTSGEGMHSAIFQTPLYGTGVPVTFDSGGVQINASGARNALTLINQTGSPSTRRTAMIAAGKGGSTGFSFGTDRTGLDTQNWGVFDVASGADRLYIGPDGGLGINTQGGGGTQFVTAIKTWNGQAALQMENNSAGASARADIIASVSGNRLVSLGAFSAAYTPDPGVAGDVGLFASGAGNPALHFGTSGQKRMTLHESQPWLGIGVDPPTVALDVVGTVKASTSINYPSGNAFPTSPALGDTFIVTDDSAVGACNSSAGSAKTLCRYSGAVWQPIGDGGAAAGDVVGPASATADAIAVYSGTTGKIIKNSTATVVAGLGTFPGGIDTGDPGNTFRRMTVLGNLTDLDATAFPASTTTAWFAQGALGNQVPMFRNSAVGVYSFLTNRSAGAIVPSLLNFTNAPTTGFVVTKAAGDQFTYAAAPTALKYTYCTTLYDRTALAATDDQPSLFRAPANITITEVWCEGDEATGTVINLQRDDGTPANILSANKTCTSTAGTGTIDVAEDNVADGQTVDLVVVSVAGTPGLRLHLCFEYQYD